MTYSKILNGIAIILSISILFSCGEKKEERAWEYEPSIVILAPSNYQIEGDSFALDIEEENKILVDQIRSSQDSSFLNDTSRKENLRLMNIKSLEFSKKANIHNQAANKLGQFLFYYMSTNFDNALIYAVQEKSDSTKASLSQIAKKYDCQFLVNLNNVKYYKKDTVKYVDVKLQVYSNLEDNIVLSGTYTGDNVNKRGELKCEDGSITCSINKAILNATQGIIFNITPKLPTVIAKLELRKKRKKELIETYYKKDPEKQVVRIIRESDRTMDIGGFYHGFMNASKDKLIGFFLTKHGGSYYKSHVIVGINENSKWYFKKDKEKTLKSTDIESARKDAFSNLQRWEFFEENSLDRNDNFWETYFFDKVEDVTKKEDYMKLRRVYEKQEREDKPYIGMYRIIADYKKEKEKQSNEIKEKALIKNVIDPFIAKLRTQSLFDTIITKQMNRDYLLLYPLKKDVFINALTVKKGEKEELVYFAFLKEEKGYGIYNWTYLNQDDFKTTGFGPSVKNQINSMTKWDFTYRTIEDQDFWQTFVLAKDGNDGNYKYLKKIEKDSEIVL